MTDRNFELTRRKALAGLATVGAAGAGAGLGTSALFSDTESFLNNSIQAGTLDLVVDYYTSTDQGSFGTSSQSGEVNGDLGAQYTYTVSDLKPGDSGTLAFCPKVIDNPAYLSVSSSGVTDYENGHTEPEQEIDDDSPDEGSLTGGNDGDGYGELSDAIEVTVSYAGSVSYDSANDQITCNNTRELNNPQGYTLDDLVTDLGYGFPLDGNEPNDGDDTIDAYPGSSGPDDQQGPCLCIEWEIPTDVGNEIQSDALEVDFEFAAEQARNNDAPPAVLYNDFYNHFNGASTIEEDYSDATDGPTGSWAYAALNASGHGGIVGLGPSGAPGFELTSGAVIMSNWNGWDSSGGPGTSTPGYTHPFTLELYEVDRTGSDPAAGPLVDDFTETQDVPGREITDGSNEEYAGNGTNFLMEWDLGGLAVNSDELLFMVSFDIPDSSQDQFKNEALSSMNILAYDTEGPTPQRTAGYAADGNIWSRVEPGDGGALVGNNLIDDTGDPEFFNTTDINDEFGTSYPADAGQVMSRFEGRPL